MAAGRLVWGSWGGAASPARPRIFLYFKCSDGYTTFLLVAGCFIKGLEGFTFKTQFRGANKINAAGINLGMPSAYMS